MKAYVQGWYDIKKTEQARTTPWGGSHHLACPMIWIQSSSAFLRSADLRFLVLSSSLTSG